MLLVRSDVSTPEQCSVSKKSDSEGDVLWTNTRQKGMISRS